MAHEQICVKYRDLSSTLDEGVNGFNFTKMVFSQLTYSWMGMMGKQTEEVKELNASENTRTDDEGLESKQLWETATEIFNSCNWNVTLLGLRGFWFQFSVTILSPLTSVDSVKYLRSNSVGSVSFYTTTTLPTILVNFSIITQIFDTELFELPIELLTKPQKK